MTNVPEDRVGEEIRDAIKVDGEAVKAALKKTGGNKARAARILGVGRATLYRHLKDI